MRYVTLAERPELGMAMWRMGHDWPEFMRHDPVGDVFFGRLPEVFPEWQQLLLDDDDRVVGKVNAIPFPWDGTHDDLPDRGWDAVLERGFDARRCGIPATAVSLLEARLVRDLLGGGRSRAMLEAMGARAVDSGLLDLVGPVRPTRKHEDPHAPMAENALTTRGDGLPLDPWLRVHAWMGGPDRQGGVGLDGHPGDPACVARVDRYAVRRSGDVVVPFACNPVHVDLAQDHAVYVEPNVWVHHDLRSRRHGGTPEPRSS
jgi:hypothetical protein